MTTLLLLLAILPLATYNLSKVLGSKHRWLLTGVTMGMVIAPVSLALVQMTYIPIVGKLLGLVGLVTNLIHGSVGYFGLMTFGVIEPGTILVGSELLVINLVNALIWSLYYGTIGYNMDPKPASVAVTSKSKVRAAI